MTFKRLTTLFLKSKHFPFVFLILFTQSVFLSFAQVLTKTSAYNDGDQIRFALIVFLVSLLTGAILKIYSFYIFGSMAELHDESSIVSFLKNKIIDWGVVEIRVQIRVLVRMLLLIVPGIIEALKLSFALPYVFFDPRMKDPFFDPVIESKKQLHWGSKFLKPLFLFTIVFPLAIFALTHSNKIIFENASNLIFAIIATTLQTLGFIFSTSYTIYAFALTIKNQNNKSKHSDQEKEG